MLNWLLRIGVVLAAVAAGYAIGTLQHLVAEIDKPVVVSKGRLDELVGNTCRGNLSYEPIPIAIVRKIFDDPNTDFQDFELTLVRDNDGRNCVFDYALSGNSYVQGRAFGHFNDEGNLVRIDFFNRLDTDLIHKERPSFSVHFFHHEETVFVFETIRNTLYMSGGRKGLSVESLARGSLRSRVRDLPADPAGVIDQPAPVNGQ